jgi:hypothetical protein
MFVSTFVTFTMAFGMDAPELSFTVPTILAVGSWANDGMQNSKHTATANAAFLNWTHLSPNVFSTSQSSPIEKAVP